MRHFWKRLQASFCVGSIHLHHFQIEMVAVLLEAAQGIFRRVSAPFRATVGAVQLYFVESKVKSRRNVTQRLDYGGD